MIHARTPPTTSELIRANFGKLILSIIFLGGAAMTQCACVPIPRTLPPGLKAWATEKAIKIGTCTARGHRGQDLIDCVGEFAADRGTYACERLRETATATAR